MLVVYVLVEVALNVFQQVEKLLRRGLRRAVDVYKDGGDWRWFTECIRKPDR